ncbi:unnamed protein product [Meganyctiphanes norvegica]|uniref:Diacylglycerol O-acyltransferase n=1 Tax=Meganyctiphanes norvegica TaxID=48144 RepID=A0AAV2RY19_MEGNR
MGILYVLGHISKILLGLLLHVILLPIAVPILLIFWIISRMVKLHLWLWYGGKTYKTKGMDALWGLETEQSRPVITILMTLSGQPDVDKVRRCISEKVLDVQDASGVYKYRKLRQLFLRRFGYYVWQDHDDFHVNNHVTKLQLEESEGSDWASQVSEYISNAETDTLVKGLPPWHITLLHTGNSPFDRYNLVILLHHAIADGVSLVRVLLESFVDMPIEPTIPPNPTINNFIRALTRVWAFVVLPVGMLKIIANYDKNTLHGPKLSGKKVVVWSQGLPLDLVRQVKTAANATVNDVLMTCLAAAMAKKFTERGESVGRISTVIPVSFHRRRGAARLNNKFSCGIVKLYTKSSLTAKERLVLTKRVFDGYKRDPTLTAIYWTTAAVSDVLPATLAEMLFTAKGVSLVASNTPGPQQKMSIWGDTVEDVIFWVPNRAPSGVGISLFSYNGVIKAGLNVDSALMATKEEGAALLQEMESEVYVLQRELLTGVQGGSQADSLAPEEQQGRIHRVKVSG